MGTGSPVDFTSPAAEAWWREQAKGALRLGVEGIKADDGEGYYFPPDVRFADGRTGAQAGWAYGLLYRRAMQRALDEAHPGEGVLFGRSGWTGQQGVGITWGGDQASDFWSLETLVTATLTAAASGFSNWSHDVGGYLGERLVARCPKELLLRWAAFGCFTPLMQAHGRFAQEAWTYDAETLAAYRGRCCCTSGSCPTCGPPPPRRHERACRSSGRCCSATPRTSAAGRSPTSTDTAPRSGWRRCSEQGVREREVSLPRGDWVDLWNGRAPPRRRRVAGRPPRSTGSPCSCARARSW